MIDFNKPITRIHKFTLKEGDFYLKDVSSAQCKDFSDKTGLDDDKEGSLAEFLTLLFDNMICDENGVLLNLSKDKLSLLPKSLVRDITEKITEIVLGEKKS